MKKKTVYIADNGTICGSAKEAKKIDASLKDIKSVKKLIGGSPQDPHCKFANGEGYYQLDKGNVYQFDEILVKMIEAEFRSDEMPTWWKNSSNRDKLNSYYIGRLLNDSDSLLYELLSTRLCVDSKFRRWGQPYFAKNENAGDQKCLGNK